MSKELRPGKGFRIPFGYDLADWLSISTTRIVEEMENAMGDEGGPIIGIVATGMDGWEFETDKYGNKVYSSYDLEGGGQLRITVIATPEGKLRLDIREWFVVG